jgi:hypothetical protein
MIPWASVRPALVELIGSIANDQDLIPEWAHRRQTFESPTIQQSVYLRVSTVAQEGRDQSRYVEESDELYEELSGHRLVTLQIKCEAYADLDGEWSFQTAERIRTRLGRRSSLDALLAINCALVDTMASVDASYEHKGHIRNVAVFDAILRCTFTDVSADPGGHWTHILLTSDIRSTPDDSLPSPPNFSGEQIGPFEE